MLNVCYISSTEDTQAPKILTYYFYQNSLGEASVNKYDTRRYTVNVEIADNGAGVLTCNTTYVAPSVMLMAQDSDSSSLTVVNADTATFTNTLNAKYTVKYETQNSDGTYTTVSTQTKYAAAGASVTPEVVDIPGYKEPSSQTTTVDADGNTVVEYKYTSVTTATYKVHYYLQRADKTDYEIVDDDTVTITAEYGKDDSSSEVKTYEGYTSPEHQSVFVNADNSSEINYYYTINSYEVTFNNQKHGETPDKQTIVYTLKVTDPGDLSETGYTFGGWYTESTCDTKWDFDNDTMPAKNITLYAKWTANKYKVIFNSNKPDTCSSTLVGKMDDLPMTYDKFVPLTENAYKLTGWTFTGWAKTANGEVAYTDKQEVGNLATNEGDEYNMYAVWSPNVYDVVYHINAPENCSSEHEGNMEVQKMTYDVKANLTTNDFRLAGYTYHGWAKTEEGEVAYSDGQEVLNLATETDANVDMYANWTANKYTITFDGNKPDMCSSELVGEMDNLPMTYDVAKNLTKNAFELTGWTFDGWAKSVDGEVVFKDEEEATNLSTIDGDTCTLYAKWSPNIYSVAYHINAPEKCTSEHEGEMEDQELTYDVEDTLTPNEFKLAGYTYNGWAETEDGDVVYKDEEEVLNLATETGYVVDMYANWTVNKDTKYKVNHWQLDESGARGAAPTDTDDLTGTTEELTSAVAKSYDGYTVKEFEQSNIKGDGSTVVDIEYSMDPVTASTADSNLFILIASLGAFVLALGPICVARRRIKKH